MKGDIVVVGESLRQTETFRVGVAAERHRWAARLSLKRTSSPITKRTRRTHLRTTAQYNMPAKKH